MPARLPLTRLVCALSLITSLSAAPAFASDPKPAADEAKTAKPAAKAAAAEEAKAAKPAADEAKAGKAAKSGHGDEPKTAKGGHGGEDAKTAKSAAAGHNPAKAANVAAVDGEAAKLEELGAKIAEKLARAKAQDAGTPLVIRVKGSERAAAPSHGGGQSAAPARPTIQPELHAMVLAASQREAARSAGDAGHGAGHAVHWAYTGENGPQNWARLKPEFARCAEGARQSPINIRGGIKVDLEPISFEYRLSSFSVVDNGHTVQVNMDSGNYIAVMGRRYELLQFHFHRPAEERVDGRVYDMVAHLVHKDPEGRLAVIAVLMDRGQAHPMIQTVWNNLPLERGEELGGTAQIDLSKLLPVNRAYYTYMGSLTTPPCSEGVLWMVMKEPIQVSNEQVAIFSRLYPMNARPLQAMGGRLIKESN